MSISIYNINKWIKMLFGKSILHVNQGIGQIYSTSDVKGYYNDLTEKVTRCKNYNEVKLPVYKLENGTDILFPIAIFQYGLGAYDLYLLKKEMLYMDKFKLCVNWALDNLQEDGSWNNFFFSQPDAPYSSMAQGEGVSLLIRAYKEFKDVKYLFAAKKAVEFMIKPIEKGGTTKYVYDEIYLLEITNKPTVLNGWIFSLFGLYDYLKVVRDENVKNIYNISIQTLTNKLKDFDNGYWSKYDNDCIIASPFYHRLHISQLHVMYIITEEVEFLTYMKKWSDYNKNIFNRYKAFIVKGIQKAFE